MIEAITIGVAVIGCLFAAAFVGFALFVCVALTIEDLKEDFGRKNAQDRSSK